MLRLEVLIATVAAGALAVSVEAADLTANPGDNLRDLVASLAPGDTLTLNPGVYDPDVSGYGTIRVSDLDGSAGAWTTIRSATPGSAIIHPRSDGCCNVLELRNSSYIRIEGLTIDGRGIRDVDAIKTVIASPATWDTDAVHHVEIVGLTIHNFDLTSAVGISTKCITWDIEVRDCRIYDIRTGLYIGNSDGTFPALDFRLVHNFIGPTGGYGAQLKHQEVRSGLAATLPSSGSEFRDNVFVRDPGLTTDYRPLLFIGGVPPSGPGSDDVNIIEGNAFLGNPEDAALQVGGGNVRVINNIILGVDDGNGIRITPKTEGPTTYVPRNIEVHNNTILKGSGGPAGLSLQNFDTTPGLTQVIANNAIFRTDPSDEAIRIVGGFAPGAVLVDNVYFGTVSGPATGMVASPLPPSGAFVNAVESPGSVDLYPLAGGPLEDAGTTSAAPSDDFDRTSRIIGAAVEIGAYELDPALAGNPGWPLDRDFKTVAATALYRSRTATLVMTPAERFALWDRLANDPPYVSDFASGASDPDPDALGTSFPLAGYRVDGHDGAVRLVRSGSDVVIRY